MRLDGFGLLVENMGEMIRFGLEYFDLEIVVHFERLSLKNKVCIPTQKLC